MHALAVPLAFGAEFVVYHAVTVMAHVVRCPLRFGAALWVWRETFLGLCSLMEVHTKQ